MTDIKLTDEDFKEVSNITGIEYYNVNEKWVKQIFKNQEIVEKLKSAIDKYDGKADYEFTVKVLKEILGDVKVK